MFGHILQTFLYGTGFPIDDCDELSSDIHCSTDMYLIETLFISK